ncbi:hypothetical protein R6Q59_003711 [Mikania micrantha]
MREKPIHKQMRIVWVLKSTNSRKSGAGEHATAAGRKRYFDVDETVRKLVMHRLGELLRNFRRKLRQTYILPNQNTPSKLNEVPKKYSAIVKESEWVAFVNHTSTEEYQGKSVATKMARSKCLYHHTMGRGGYVHVKEKMIKNKEIEADEEPPRALMWLKGRQNKAGDFLNDETRLAVDKLKETDEKINEGTLMVDQGTDAMTVVFGKEKGVYARGVGSGVTYKKYFNLPQKKQASDERLALLQSQLDNERRERQEKEAVIMNLSNEVAQTKGMITQLMSQLAAQGVKLPLLSTQVTASNVDVNPKNSSTDQEGRSPLNEVGCKKDASNQKSNGVTPSENEMDTTEYKCSLWHIKRSTIIAKGTVYKSDGKQMLHGNRLPNDCYKVSIDESLVDAACIPDAQINPFKTVKDALGTFVAWPKNQVIFHEKVTPPTSITNVVENKTSPKLQKKRKFVSRDYMLKQAKTKLKSQKSLY